ncbi:ABC transporter, permease protein 1 (cluster 5, nickel/peptides/opines) [hydrothermal vent metagenome]|uniref:ABC transporter, permease protein 1 (Cluster 5, nickel/peptides/opines) n=1 Tax=hydrothermal vent metagenome TaxID=652676 RepID=A0A3B0YYE8_9ZZZZ
MPAYLFSRLLTAVWVMFGVASLVFFMLHWVPGDPVEVMLGESAASADREALRQALGLNRPVIEQWGLFLTHALHWDLGQSLYYQQPVSTLLAGRFGATLELAAAALFIALLIALPIGILAAARRGRIVDLAATGFSLLGVSIPNFWLGPLLVLIFSLGLGWFPVSGRSGLLSLLLPALTLGTGLAAILSRMVRSSLLEIMNEDFIRTARAKGLSSATVWLHHGMRNAWLPILTLVGIQLGALLGGAVITETVFNWPGLGTLLIESIQRRDYPLVQGCVLLISLCYVLVNLFTDILYTRIDPRIRLGQTA